MWGTLVGTLRFAELGFCLDPVSLPLLVLDSSLKAHMNHVLEFRV